MLNHTMTPKQERRMPFVTVGPFASKDTLFHGIAGDLELYTAEEVITLRNVGIFKSSSSASQSTPKLPSLASLGQALSSPTDPKVTPRSPKIEPDLSSKKWDHKSSSKSHKHPVSCSCQGAVQIWKNPSETSEAERKFQHETVMLSAGKGKEVGSTRTMPTPKTKACTRWHVPLNMSMVGHLSTWQICWTW